MVAKSRMWQKEISTFWCENLLRENQFEDCRRRRL